jgi:hypothetical protein
MPTTIVSPHFDNRKEAEEYLEEKFAFREKYEYAVIRTEGQTGFY